MNYKVVHCETQEQWNFAVEKLKYGEPFKNYWTEYKEENCLNLEDDAYAGKSYYEKCSSTIYSFEEWIKINNYKFNENEEKTMNELMLEVLNKTYDNLILRRRTVPLFMSNPGIGKTTIIKKFAEDKAVKMVKITLSQRMPNEVVGMMMPNSKTGKLEVYDSYELSQLQDGDILFFDEVFNGVLKQTLDAVLNLLEDRTLPSGKKMADVMIIAASNPQGLINLTPQIKERFIRYDLTFNRDEFKALLKDRYGMPESISGNLCTLINKEKFEANLWNYNTPRSIEKAIYQIGHGLQSPYNDLLIPYLSEKLVSPMDVKALNVKKGDEIEYLNLLKLIIKHDTKDNK